LRERLFAEDRLHARRRLVDVLRLLKAYSVEIVGDCIVHALACGPLDVAAIALLTHQRTASIPSAAVALALRSPPGLQRPQVELNRYALDSLAERSL